MKNLSVIDTVDKVGKEVELYGWVDSKRDHKQIIFIDLRDRTGVVQVISDQKFKELSAEDVVYIKGLVKKRPENLINPKIKTGEIEIEAKEVKILAKTKPLPLPVTSVGYDIDEEVRLKYRYLDLRRPRMIKNLIFRSMFIREIREFFYKKGFIEIETPYISSPTPEGARDFLIPSRLQKGKFYALPQSPQQYKQLLMVAGIERYFQIPRCFRDEDPRADRAYGEFTQLDLEMSFVEREDVMKITEEMIIEVYQKLAIKLKQKPFPIFTYEEVMKKFGKDKFDLRTEEEKKQNIQAFAWVIDFPFFEKTDDGGWTFTHNPFSAPLPEYKEDLLKKRNISKILTSQYDLVCNGYEVGGGSIRAHEPEVLEKVFEIMGYTKSTIWQQFGHMLEAFTYGAPPHGGIAPGVDRLLTCILDEPSLRETIAFPMTSGGRTAVIDAPSEATEEQLKELGISINSHSGKRVKRAHPESDSGPALPAGRQAIITVKISTIFEKIKRMLDKTNIQYRIYEHTPVYTSEDAAKIRGTTLKQGAKALIMYADKKPIMIVLAGDKKVDIKKFKSTYVIKDLRMATPEEVKEITKVEIGAVPPFASLFNIPLYVDESLKENAEIAFNAGSHSRSISMKYIDFEKITRPILGDFSI